MLYQRLNMSIRLHSPARPLHYSAVSVLWPEMPEGPVGSHCLLEEPMGSPWAGARAPVAAHHAAATEVHCNTARADGTNQALYTAGVVLGCFTCVFMQNVIAVYEVCIR